VIQVSCPKCGVGSGVDCISRNGKKVGDLHIARKAVVYPSFGRNLDGGSKQALASPISERHKLRKAVMAVAEEWYNHTKGDGDLAAAIMALKNHRAKHPEVQG